MTCQFTPIPSTFIGKDIASRWVNNYQMIKRPLLNSGAGDDGETKSIWYDIRKWKELMDEAICQGASGVRLYFAAYSEVPELPGEKEKIPVGANKQMNIVFVLTRMNAGVHEDIFIEEQTGFESRPKIAYPIGAYDEYDKAKARKPEDQNTGDPCPPATGCPGARLGS